MSVQIELNMDISHTDRTSYDLLNMAGDVGGVLEILIIVFTLFAYKFALLRISAIVTKRLFHLPVESRESIFNSNDLSEKLLKDHNLHKTPTGEIIFDVPRFLVYQQIVHFCHLCFNKNSKFGRYK